MTEDLRLLTIKDVAELIGFSQSWIKDGVKCGDFPQPKKVRGSTRWTTGQINDWLKELGEE